MNMNTIRFAKHAILATAVALIAVYVLAQSAGHLILVKFLGFRQDSNLIEQIGADPFIPTVIFIALCCSFALEAIRNRLRQKKSRSS